MELRVFEWWIGGVTSSCVKDRAKELAGTCRLCVRLVSRTRLGSEKDASERSMAVNVSSFCLEAVITRDVKIGGASG